jgi:hypothetical protein
MDTSQRYILMCQKAGEIQKSRDARSGDFYLDYRLKEPGISVYFSEVEEYIPNFGQRFDFEFMAWLPRQDQLQEMIDKNRIKSYEKLHYFLGGNWIFLKKFDSPEQLWLAYVMETLYSKVWSGQEWVKEEP